MGNYVLSITGATGSIYGMLLLKELLKRDNTVYFIITEQGKKVLEFEMDVKLDDWLKMFNKKKGKLIVCNNDDMFAPIASGSFNLDGMVIAPCSMGTVAKISLGISDSLMLRTADVMIKERRNLIVLPREMPLSTMHLKNLLSLSEQGVTIMPPMPAFYNKPKTLEEVLNQTVGRVLEKLGIKNHLYCVWKGIYDKN